MIEIKRASRLFVFLVAGAALTAAPLVADEPAERSEGAARKAALIEAMRTMAAGLTVVRLSEESEADCAMVENSILNWSDSARHGDLLVPGTTWIWTERGRPVLIGEIYGRTNAVGSWFLFACNLSSDRVRFSGGAARTTLTTSYYEPRGLPDAPAVAEKKSERTFQMRQLAGRFDAHQFWEERFELRLLPKPIYRYASADGRILDGAVFALVHGTNPEVLLLIEAHQAEEGPPRWKVSFGSLAGARCVVRLDGKEFWNCPKHNGSLDDPRQGVFDNVPVKEPEPGEASE